MSKLFHTLVVFSAGASLVGCGGQSTDTTSTAGGSGPGGSEPGSPNTGGAQALTGGAGGTANGGSAGVGGGPIGSGGVINLGGRPGMGGTGPVALPDPGTLAQWNCEPASQCGTGDIDGRATRGMELRDACVVDSDRPRSASECAGDSVFQCDVALFLGQTILVNCQCLPVGNAGCSSCQTEGWYGSVPLSCEDGITICECAMTGILL